MTVLRKMTFIPVRQHCSFGMTTTSRLSVKQKMTPFLEGQNNVRIPLGFVFEGTLLAGSIEAEVRATGHEIGNTFDGTEEGGGEFNLDWE
nr:hypothetical protein [Bacteroidales bacterium]